MTNLTQRKRTNIDTQERDKITISRNFYDISHLISQDMKVFPGDPTPKFDAFFTIEKDNVNVSKITLGTHTGTHVDSQRHFINDGNAVEQESLSKFIGKAFVMDFSNKSPGAGITRDDLENYSSLIRTNDIILLYTGISDYTTEDNDEIGRNFTYLDPSAADWIINHKIRSVGIDTLSVEKYGSKEAITHKKLLSSGIGIIENLNSNLAKFLGRRVFLVCLPLALKGLDGSPARTILFEILD